MFKKIISTLKLVFIPSERNNYRPKFLDSNFLFYCVLALFLLKIISFSLFFYLPKTAFFADISKALLVELTNKERESTGLSPLKENFKLDNAAFLKAQDMLNFDYFSHQSPQGITPWHWFLEAGYNYQIAGENLGIGFLDSEEIYKAWSDSSSHKANLLNTRYKDIGIAVLKGDFKGSETTVVVQLFGTFKEEINKEFKKESENLSGIESKEEVTEEIQEENQQEQEEIEEEEISPQELAGFEEEKPIFYQEAQMDLKFNLFKFMTKDYNNLLQIIATYLLYGVILGLVLNIFIRFDIQHEDLILKTIFFIIVFLIFIIAEKNILITFIPHNLGIY